MLVSRLQHLHNQFALSESGALSDLTFLQRLLHQNNISALPKEDQVCSSARLG